MNILVTLPEGPVRDTFMPPEVVKRIESLGQITWNNSKNQFKAEELKEKIKDVDVCITGWGCPQFNQNVLENANRLKLIAHTGGSVGIYVTPEVYDKEIKVLSGNLLFAESVAEGVIGYMLASLRDIPFVNHEMHEGRWIHTDNEGLLDKTIGLVGLGAVARFLVGMLKPFRAKIKAYDPYVSDEVMEEYGVKPASLEEIFSTCDIISLHAPKLPETYHMVNKELIQSIQDGALLVNTARGSIIDEDALAEELKKKRFKAVLDVYEVEPLPKDSKLIGLDNTILIPHMGGPTIDRRKYVTMALLDDIENFINGAPLKREISRVYASRMTKE